MKTLAEAVEKLANYTFEGFARILKILEEHSKIPEQHSEILKQHSEILRKHSEAV